MDVTELDVVVVRSGEVVATGLFNVVPPESLDDNSVG